MRPLPGSLCCLALLLLVAGTALAQPDGAATSRYRREANLVGAALQAREAAGAWPDLALEVADLPGTEAMPLTEAPENLVTWTFQQRATKDRDLTPIVRFVLVPCDRKISWRAVVDAFGTWFEPEVFFVDDDFLVFSRRGPSMEDEIAEARATVLAAVGKLLGRTPDPGVDAREEIGKHCVIADLSEVRKHARHLALDAAGTTPPALESLAKAYPLYWITLTHTPPEGHIAITWLPPTGAALDPDRPAVPPDSEAAGKLAAAEAHAAQVGARLIAQWRDNPKADRAERRGWVEKAGPELLDLFQKTGAYIPGTNRHEILQQRFARYLDVLE